MCIRDSPSVVLRNFQAIAKASSAMVQTSIPASEVDRFIGLAMKAKGQKVSTLSVVPPLFDTYQPDAKLIRQKVAEAIDAAEGNAPKVDPESDTSSDSSSGSSDEKPKKPKKPKTPAPVTGGSVGSLADGYAANESQDLDAAC